MENFMAAASCIAPPAEPLIEKRTLKLCAPKPKLKPVGKKRVQDLVAEIFEGYEEFLGCTSD
jgi:hypothetical protein